MAEQMMYQVRFNDGRTVLAPSKELAEMIAASMDGTVEEVARKQAIGLVRKATSTPDIPPRFAGLAKDIKGLILAALAREEEHSMLCSYEFAFRRDTHHHVWNIEVTNRAAGTKASAAICEALWEAGRSTEKKHLRRPK